MSKFAVIVAAAGRSERFGGEEKKTFAKLDGRPVFLRSLEHFVTRPDVAQLILAVAPEDLAMVRSSYGPNLAFMNVKVIGGGERRFDTVREALGALAPEVEYVAIHDAARPCVTAEMIDSVFAEATKAGAAILAAPLHGTLKRVSGARVVEETVPREHIFEAQTPQAFRRSVLVAAYSDPRAGSVETTDDAQVVELTGHPVSVVPSDAANLKITTRGDLTLAAAILKSRPARAVPRTGAFEEAQW